jgi:hypothetical protein
MAYLAGQEITTADGWEHMTMRVPGGPSRGRARRPARATREWASLPGRPGRQRRPGTPAATKEQVNGRHAAGQTSGKERTTAIYERVTFRAESGNRTVILQDPAEVAIGGVPMLTGDEVDREGLLVEPEAAFLRAHGAVTGTRRHVIELALVTRRRTMVMNLAYGELEYVQPAESPASADLTAGPGVSNRAGAEAGSKPLRREPGRGRAQGRRVDADPSAPRRHN